MSDLCFSPWQEERSSAAPYHAGGVLHVGPTHVLRQGVSWWLLLTDRKEMDQPERENRKKVQRE